MQVCSQGSMVLGAGSTSSSLEKVHTSVQKHPQLELPAAGLLYVVITFFGSYITVVFVCRNLQQLIPKRHIN